ncbi:hypothetical protein FRC03_002840 [Tulasnella sp. 419]|nr:hypothetical protein FRC03_002840 [Tulasnella sp. 419]
MSDNYYNQGIRNRRYNQTNPEQPAQSSAPSFPTPFSPVTMQQQAGTFAMPQPDIASQTHTYPPPGPPNSGFSLSKAAHGVGQALWGGNNGDKIFRAPAQSQPPGFVKNSSGPSAECLVGYDQRQSAGEWTRNDAPAQRPCSKPTNSRSYGHADNSGYRRMPEQHTEGSTSQRFTAPYQKNTTTPVRIQNPRDGVGTHSSAQRNETNATSDIYNIPLERLRFESVVDRARPRNRIRDPRNLNPNPPPANVSNDMHDGGCRCVIV